MMHVLATSNYIPPGARSLDQLLTREFMEASALPWRESHRYFSEFIRSYGFEEQTLVDAVAGIDPEAIRNQAGFDHVAVEESLTLPEMCAKASRRVTGADTVPLSAIVVCQASADADFTTNASTALRLQCEYNLKELAFAVEDHDGVNFFVALSLLANLCEGTTDLSRVLLCCGERWRHPFPRVLGTYTVLGDGVGAMLLSREAQPGWRLLGAHTEVVEEAVHPWRRLLEPHPLPSAPVIADAIGAFLGRYQLRAQCVTTVVPPHINRQLVEQVHAHVGFSEAADFREPFGRHGYLCAADPVVRLHDAFSRLDTDRSAEARLLLWGIGLNGTFGSALFARDSTT